MVENSLLCSLFYFLTHDWVTINRGIKEENQALRILGQFHQHFVRSFHTRKSQKCKKILTTWLNFYVFGSGNIKAAGKHVGEINSCSQFHQHFTYKFFVRTSFSLNTFGLVPKICTKNAREKRWWNWHLVKYRHLLRLGGIPTHNNPIVSQMQIISFLS